MKNIRNFSIIAHIDHGKSTLSDRLIQVTGIVSARDFQDQILDSMDIERERGITIKSQTVCLPYTRKSGETYSLNLIDTPGHVDFTYEVSRALASCEGALLLVDASQGVEAQTLANLYLAMEHDLEIIPVINKIDLPSADIERVKQQIRDDLGLDPKTAILASAKEGIGIDAVLDAIVDHLPPPKGDPDAPLKALIFDSHYDSFRGTVVYFRVFQGRISAGDTICFMSNEATYKVEEVGVFQIKRVPRKTLSAGQVGYMIAGIKTVSDTRCGDTITHKKERCDAPMPGFKEAKPVVFSSIYPVASDEYPELAEGLEKLKLNDSALIYEKDSSAALGFGFRCGFQPEIVVGQGFNRPDEIGVVVQGFPHPHANDIGEAPRRGAVVLKIVQGVPDLGDNLPTAEVSDQPALGGQAELTALGAAHLAGNTQGVVVFFGDQDAFDVLSVFKPVECFAGAVGGCLHLFQVQPADAEMG